jgi:hypothetical protein
LKYLVESDQERQAEPPIDPRDAFFKSIAARVKTFSPYHQKICKSRIFAIVSEVEMTEMLQETKPTHSSDFVLALQMNLGYNESVFVMQTRPHCPISLHISSLLLN